MPVAAAAVPHPTSLQALIAKYDGNTPRYTSYPTAVQFTPEVGGEVYRDWLGQLPRDEAVSLYVHVPFCSRLCWYCGCNTRVVNRAEPVEEYVELLKAEIAQVVEALPGRIPAAALHFGGGTPNMLSAAGFEAVVQSLRSAFDMDGDLEMAVELDPASLTRDWLLATGRQGLSRASLGVQTLSPKVQAAVNRRESFEEIAACVGWLREAGVRSINLDLMYGLPFQTVGDVIGTLDQVMRLRPERLAVFGYAHVPWMKSHQQLIDANALPDLEARFAQSESAAGYLKSAGYVRIGIDHYALPDDPLAVAWREGALHRNFQGYTTDRANTLIGFGTSAIGRLPEGYVQNAAQELAWRQAVQAGRLPVVRGRGVTDEDRFRGEIIERLMCDLTVDLAEVSARHGRQVGELDAEKARLDPFVDDGLIRIEGDWIVVEEPGRLLVRSVCAVFDAYVDTAAGRHSRTV